MHFFADKKYNYKMKIDLVIDCSPSISITRIIETKNIFSDSSIVVDNKILRSNSQCFESSHWRLRLPPTWNVSIKLSNANTLSQAIETGKISFLFSTYILLCSKNAFSI